MISLIAEKKGVLCLKFDFDTKLRYQNIVVNRRHDEYNLKNNINEKCYLQEVLLLLLWGRQI